MRRIAMIAALWLCPLGAARAEPLVAPSSERPAQVGVEVAAEPGLGLSVWGLGRVARWDRWGEVRVGGGWGFPVATVSDGRTFDAHVGASWRVLWRRRLGVATRLGAGVASARNARLDLVGLRLGLSVAPGWYAPHWFVAFGLGYAPTLSTHVAHREASRRAFEDRYPGGTGGEGPRDGWYRTPAHRLRAGVEAGGVIVGRVSLFGAAGFQSPVGGLNLVSLPDVGRLPFFVTTGIGVALGTRATTR